MPLKDLFFLVLLAAIWGSSFIFMRLIVPALGPVMTACVRLLVSGGLLSFYFSLSGLDLEWRRYWKPYLILGAVNSAMPFALYAFAALYIPASYSVILNSTSPMFGALFSAIWLKDPVTTSRLVGLLCGALGVFIVARVGPISLSVDETLAIVACLVASAGYGLAGVYIRRKLSNVRFISIASASQLMAGLVLLPPVLLTPAPAGVTVNVLLYLAVLSVVCTGGAYLLYFYLIQQHGPTKALTVTFLMPIFGVIWGALFLSEAITAQLLLGCIVILIGTALVLGVLPVARHRRRPVV